jgi:hypothetical protein
VTVEYLTREPGYSRIGGMRRDILGPWALMAGLVPGAGLVFAMLGLRRGRRAIRLLRDGLPAPGLLTGKTATGARVMGRAVYRMTFDFTARDGITYSTTVSTNRPELLEDEEQESVLYDASDPDCAVPIDALPGKLSLDHAGRIVAGPSRAFLTLPVASLLLNAWFAYRHLG